MNVSTASKTQMSQILELNSLEIVVVNALMVVSAQILQSSLALADLDITTTITSPLLIIVSARDASLECSVMVQPTKQELIF
jgi:hypothetical protein